MKIFSLCPSANRRSPIALPTLWWLLAFVALDSRSAATPGDAAEPIEPHARVTLFNGKDLLGFYPWVPAFGREDPTHIFSVVDQIDGAPAIRISGQYFGGLVTKQAFKNYRLVAEFRWGLVTWAPREKLARDAGILLHCTGEDGNAKADFHSPWSRSIEFQIIEGGTGDLLLLGGFDRGSPVRVDPRADATVRPGTRVWQADGKSTPFTDGRIDWFARDPQWSGKLAFRGAADIEHPTGEWNHLEAICAGGRITYFVNGTKVNEVTNCTFQAGRILLQSEGAEIYFRRVELLPLEP